jgi:hypothetical protein
MVYSSRLLDFRYLDLLFSFGTSDRIELRYFPIIFLHEKILYIIFYIIFCHSNNILPVTWGESYILLDLQLQRHNKLIIDWSKFEISPLPKHFNRSANC